MIFSAFIAWSGVAGYRFKNQYPDYFNQGIEQLHSSQYIKDRMGDFSSYSLPELPFAEKTQRQATFQVQIFKDTMDYFLTCTMSKDIENWKLASVKEDSVKLISHK